MQPEEKTVGSHPNIIGVYNPVGGLVATGPDVESAWKAARAVLQLPYAGNSPVENYTCMSISTNKNPAKLDPPAPVNIATAGASVGAVISDRSKTPTQLIYYAEVEGGPFRPLIIKSSTKELCGLVGKKPLIMPSGSPQYAVLSEVHEFITAEGARFDVVNRKLEHMDRWTKLYEALLARDKQIVETYVNTGRLPFLYG